MKQYFYLDPYPFDHVYVIKYYPYSGTYCIAEFKSRPYNHLERITPWEKTSLNRIADCFGLYTTAKTLAIPYNELITRILKGMNKNE